MCVCVCVCVCSSRKNCFYHPLCSRCLSNKMVCDCDIVLSTHTCTQSVLREPSRWRVWNESRWQREGGRRREVMITQKLLVIRLQSYLVRNCLFGSFLGKRSRVLFRSMGVVFGFKSRCDLWPQHPVLWLCVCVCRFKRERGAEWMRGSKYRKTGQVRVGVLRCWRGREENFYFPASSTWF